MSTHFNFFLTHGIYTRARAEMGKFKLVEKLEDFKRHGYYYCIFFQDNIRKIMQDPPFTVENMLCGATKSEKLSREEKLHYTLTRCVKHVYVQVTTQDGKRTKVTIHVLNGDPEPNRKSAELVCVPTITFRTNTEESLKDHRIYLKSKSKKDEKKNDDVELNKEIYMLAKTMDQDFNPDLEPQSSWLEWINPT